MTKIEFYSLCGYGDSNIAKVKREGYTDGKYQYYRLGSVWFAIVPGYGASIATGKTRKEAQAKAHEKTEALEKIIETNGEKLRERFLNAPTQEEIERNARVAEEQHTETETEEETAEETTEPTTEPEEEKENESMTTIYNITYNAQYDSREVTFESKPATAVLDALKALKMRWNPKKACWYGFAKEHEIVNAILENGEGETITGEKTEGATVYTDGYLGGGAVYGSKSNLHLYGADLSKAIREDIKRAGIKGVSVRCKSYSGGQSIGVTVTLRPDEYISFSEFLKNYRIKGNSWIYTAESPSGIHSDRYFEMSAEEQQETRAAAAAYDYERMTTRENLVNEFHINEENHFTPETLAKIKTIQAIICAYRYDESNGMVDYFDTNFYYDIYTKPSAVKPTTPDNEPTKSAKDEPKEEPAAEETAPVLRAVQAQGSAKVPRYQVIVNDDRYGGLDEKLDYSRITDARKAMHDYVNKEDWESAAIYDRKSGEIIETYGEYFPVDQINVRAKAQEAESVAESVVETAEAPAETEDEPETVPESAGAAPEEVPGTVGFHPIINNLLKKSKWDVWNVHPDEYLSSCVVPLVRCDENYHVLDTVYLKVDTPEEAKTLMSAAAVGNRRRWPKYNKQYRRETVQRAAEIIEKYYI